jgi:ABC transport system ATP-binding/permease protein
VDRAARKELIATERKLERLAQKIAEIHERMAAHAHSDYEGLGLLDSELRAAEAQTEELEERWLELSETVD